MRLAWGSIKRLLADVVTPFGALVNIAGFAGLTVSSALLAVRGDPVWAVSIVIAALAVLLARSAYRLQRQADRRGEWSLDVVQIAEPVDGRILFLGEVQHRGPSSTLYARIHDVDGVWPDYQVALPVWRDSGRSSTTVESNGFRYLRIAEFDLTDRSFYFLSSDDPNHAGPGWKWDVRERWAIEMTITIVNSGSADETLSWLSRITVDPKAGTGSFEPAISTHSADRPLVFRASADHH